MLTPQELLIDPTRLSALDASALTCLKLYNVIGRPAQDGPALLSALASLTALKHLGLIDNFWDAPLPVEQFASITAATGLTALCLVDCSQQPLPLGALQHILPSGKQPCWRLQCAVSGLSGQQCLLQLCATMQDAHVCCVWLLTSQGIAL